MLEFARAHVWRTLFTQIIFESTLENGRDIYLENSRHLKLCVDSLEQGLL